jgi:hypothetical protein
LLLNAGEVTQCSQINSNLTNPQLLPIIKIMEVETETICDCANKLLKKRSNEDHPDIRQNLYTTTVRKKATSSCRCHPSSCEGKENNKFEYGKNFLGLIVDKWCPNFRSCCITEFKLKLVYSPNFPIHNLLLREPTTINPGTSTGEENNSA